MLTKHIEELLYFGLMNNMMTEWDIPLVRNQLLSLLKESEPYEVEVNNLDKDEINLETPLPILEKLIDGAVKNGLLEDNITERDLLDAKIMGCLMPRQGELCRTFYDLAEEDKEKATNFFYKLSKDSNYIRMDRIAKNLNWKANTEYGNLDITINLSKPEKDPKEIAKARLIRSSNYPKCLLCLENVGYEGRLNHPGRSNHRVIPLTLDNEQWYLQYSPYVYYNEHSIVFKGKHEPMKISRQTFVRLLDFVDVLPHYFLGSNADLPIVGGSILSHDHFQGGHYTFPMEVAPIMIKAKSDAYEEVNIGVVKWPLSVVRLSSKHKGLLVELAEFILNKWRNYSDEAREIFAYTVNEEGESVPHNTITPISRINKEGLYELDLVLRNNRQSDEHPDGIFHPHEHLHHIKKENIGLIEVMGLAVLPARLKDELDIIKNILIRKYKLEEVEEKIKQHVPWIDKLIKDNGISMTVGEADILLQKEVGEKFVQVLECAGVYKDTEDGHKGIVKFLEYLDFIMK